MMNEENAIPMPAAESFDEPLPLLSLPQDDPKRVPKLKRSYSVDRQVCADLDVLAWYHETSASAIVEKLLRKYLDLMRDELGEARRVRSRT